jgi:hypothetical protein
MPETQNIVFDFKEVVEALLKEQNIHEGLWGIYFEFGIGAANVNRDAENVYFPAAIVPVVKIGIQRFPSANNLTVDASLVGVKKPQIDSSSKNKPASTE